MPGSPPPTRKRKAWGQHFLVRPAATRRILDLLQVSPQDRFLEIGPGLGALTLGIAGRGAAVLAVEIDPDLIARLGSSLGPGERVRLVAGDILKLDLEKLIRSLRGGSPRRPVRVVGNLPYHIATAVLQRFLAPGRRVRDLHFMFQQEVAERIVAHPGNPAYGYLSVLCQVHGRARIRLRVPPGAFRPPPRVHSAFVSLIPQAPPWRSAAAESRFRRLLQVAFASRRKTLANNLRHRFGWTTRAVQEILADSGLPPRARAEELSPPEFLRLFARVRHRGVLT